MDISEYEKQIEIYRKQASSTRGVRSVYLMGSIRSPGLSDIDIITVVDDDFDPAHSSTLSTNYLDQNLFLHGPMIVPQSMATEVQSIIYASNLTLLHGIECLPDWELLDAKTKERLSICHLIDFIENRFAQVSRMINKPLNKRAWLTRIWSTAHSLSLYRSLLRTGETIPSNIIELEKKVLATRAIWNEEKFVSDDRFYQSWDAAVEINHFIFAKVLSSWYGKPLLARPYKFKGPMNIMRFKNGTTRPRYQTRSISFMGRRISFTYADQMPEYLAHLQEYVKVTPQWEVHPTINQGLSLVRQQRSRVVRSHSRWLLKHAPNSRSLRGHLGMGIVPTNGLDHLIKSLLTRLHP